MAEAAEGPHRQIRDEADLADVVAQRHAAISFVDVRLPVDVMTTNLPDVREVASAERPPAQEDAVRVPSAAETADTVRRAQRALAEIHRCRATDDRQAAEQERVEQLNRWHAKDYADDRTRPIR